MGKRKQSLDHGRDIRWMGTPLNRDHRGDTYYGGVMIDDEKFMTGDDVLLEGGAGKLPYIARIDTLWEDTDGRACFIAQW
jgi:hypothetical protein